MPFAPDQATGIRQLVLALLLALLPGLLPGQQVPVVDAPVPREIGRAHV